MILRRTLLASFTLSQYHTAITIQANRSQLIICLPKRLMYAALLKVHCTAAQKAVYNDQLPLVRTANQCIMNASYRFKHSLYARKSRRFQ